VSGTRDRPILRGDLFAAIEDGDRPRVDADAGVVEVARTER
jgi:hypothetical protein